MLRRLAAPSCAAAAGLAAWRAEARRAEAQPAAGEHHVPSDAAAKLMATAKLRSCALRAQETLSDPPAAFRRFAHAKWQTHAEAEVLAALEASRGVLADVLVTAARSWKETGLVEPRTLVDMDRAAEQAEDAVRAVRASAVRGASAAPWHVTVGGHTLERADGTERGEGGSGGATSIDSLGGKLVGLYFTASWCGPCRRFSPKLVELYEAARARAAGFEVVMVSWDELRSDREQYALANGMRWLALPHEERTLSDELTLRYDVQHIPTLVVLRLSDDGKHATIVSRNGRDEVEAGNAEWVRRLHESPGGETDQGWMAKLTGSFRPRPPAGG